MNSVRSGPVRTPTIERQADEQCQTTANETGAAARVYELVPLCRRDVENAARDYQIDPAGFLQQVHDLEIAAFAALPNTLRMLLKIKMQTDRLPATKTGDLSPGLPPAGGRTGPESTSGGFPRPPEPRRARRSSRAYRCHVAVGKQAVSVAGASTGTGRG
jgi:hypothetical protein